jgi:hypothetical protein
MVGKSNTIWLERPSYKESNFQDCGYPAVSLYCPKHAKHPIKDVHEIHNFVNPRNPSCYVATMFNRLFLKG